MKHAVTNDKGQKVTIDHLMYKILRKAFSDGENKIEIKSLKNIEGQMTKVTDVIILSQNF